MMVVLHGHEHKLVLEEVEWRAVVGLAGIYGGWGFGCREGHFGAEDARQIASGLEQALAHLPDDEPTEAQMTFARRSWGGEDGPRKRTTRKDLLLTFALFWGRKKKWLRQIMAFLQSAPFRVEFRIPLRVVG